MIAPTIKLIDLRTNFKKMCKPVGAIIDRPCMDLRTNLKICTILKAFPSGEGGTVGDR